ncbi:MAG: SDR family oxidoreductase [Parvibaculum sp.]|jgi:citronellol/citronellal dehydrogenase|uniref:Peroxisomal trans-2-enoyl-CoA reductase n=1 Tax=Parvibaculum lavamentivorans (strain DS-1 / DSM 13023 / NCIMB 13966) TaxID=402881 RepID=A7HU03_PARL1|nr:MULTISPECIES: SDR family oxidoreductase [Parvibaculum]ABS63386.1 short-chain dehydrogenase/reductase SDR [Parvibaculum lavamentivorans DS-1]MBX3493028.1 SDR family oxidoreductase [Parvibaculum sp.]MBX3497475.1 SDR family oxidoreductase [Parvibaculum sp.]MCW5726771.1 SDR family oxidoreductase [Parvibaculum sp.]MDO9126994.1 SDR family oxidoreductase [Parvibaculum sp.]
MEVQKTRFGFSDEELKALPTVYRADLFSGKTVVVSGGGSGFGKAIACLLARLGANVAICGRNEEKLAATVSLLESMGAQVFSRSLTIRDPDQVDGFIEAVWDKFGALDLLVNNAGGQFPQMALDFKVKGWNAVIDTNLNGTWYMMQSAARQWVERKTPGSIVNIIADIWRGMPGIAHTCAARAGVAYLSKSVAVEWAPHRIRVNCVAPGVCETSGFAQYPPEGLKTYPGANPMLHVGDAHDIAEAVAYLASPGAKFITGEVLTVDGGEQLWGDPWPPGRPDYFQPK